MNLIIASLLLGLKINKEIKMNTKEIMELKTKWNNQIWSDIDIIEREPHINDTERQVLIGYLKMQLFSKGKIGGKHVL